MFLAFIGPPTSVSSMNGLLLDLPSAFQETAGSNKLFAVYIQIRQYLCLLYLEIMNVSTARNSSVSLVGYSYSERQKYIISKDHFFSNDPLPKVFEPGSLYRK